MIGKNAGPNQVMVKENYQLYNSPQKPKWDIMTKALGIFWVILLRTISEIALE